MDTDERVEERTQELLRTLSPERLKLIPILQEAQAIFGYLPREAMQVIALFLGIPEIDVFGVATFYNQFRLKPLGKHHIRVCMGTACHMKGGKVILEAWERELGISVGDTTPDREFSLDRVACVGCCAMAPVAVIGEDDVHGRITPTKVRGIVFTNRMQRESEEEAAGGE